MGPSTLPDPAAPVRFATEHDVAVAAAREAGAVLRARFHEDHEVRPKGDRGDVVTDLDTISERLIVKRLREHFVYDRILAEESGCLDGAGGVGRRGQGADRTWLVDPLDGSNNVVIGLPAYVVGIALCVDGLPAVGVVHDPVADRTWTALSGCGAHGPFGRLTGPAGASSPAGPVLAWTQGHSVARDDPAMRALKGVLDMRARRLLQLWAPLLAWVMLARGDIDGFVGYRPELIDLPAGALLAAEAGVEIRSLDGGSFSAGLGDPATSRGFVAGRPDILPYLLDLVTASTPLNR
jgi:myo-inositol-1(or 4)-monophosphatase